MNLLFVYFNRKQICTNAQEATDFINSLHYRGNGYGLISVNTWTSDRLNQMFDGRINDGDSIQTTGCGTTYIRVFKALGQTLAEHDAIFAARKITEAEELEKAREESEARRAREMSQIREGMYIVKLVYPVIVGYLCRTVMKSYSRKVFAKSGNDALAQVVKEFNSLPDGGYYEYDSVRFIFK